MRTSPILDALGDLVLGSRCPGCEVPALGWCPRCRRRLAGLTPAPVTRQSRDFPVTVAAGEYAGALRNVILTAKEKGGLAYLPLLAGLLADAVSTLVAQCEVAPALVTLVPVPSARARVVERGLDLTADLSRRAAAVLRAGGHPARVSRAIALCRQPRAQAGLDSVARALNSRGAYRWSEPAEGAVVVVDDVVTTGATLCAVGTAARVAGVCLLGAATIAETRRRSA